MTYVLIVVSWLGGAVNGAAVSTQEFANLERCEAARLALVTDAKARALEDHLGPSVCKSETAVLGTAAACRCTMPLSVSPRCRKEGSDQA